MNNAVTKTRLENCIAYWRSLKAGTKGQAKLIRQTISEMEARLKALG